MTDTTILHNKSCGSSRKALAWLQGQDGEVDVVEYLKAPLDRDGLGLLLDQLDGSPGDLVRHDKRFGELGLDPDAYTTREAVIDVLVEHPELMQRPVVVSGGRAVIARPPEETLERFFA